MLSDEQRLTRWGRVTASIAPAVLGHHKQMDRMDAYNAVRVMNKDDWPSDRRKLVKDPRWLGHLFEEPMRRMLNAILKRHFVEEAWTETKIERGEHPLAFLPLPWDWAAASPDGFIYPAYDLPGPIAGFEAKHVTYGFNEEEWGEEWTNAVPMQFFLQCQWGMYVTGLRRWFLVALIFGNPRFYLIARDENVIKVMERECAKFYFHHVLPGIPPDPGEKGIVIPVKRREYVPAGDAEKHCRVFLEIWKAQQVVKAMDPRRKEVAREIIAATGENLGLIHEPYKLSVIRSKDKAPYVKVIEPKKERSDE